MRGRRGRSGKVVLGVGAGATAALLAPAAAAADITVNSLADPTDPGKTTLRDAITSANSAAGADRIVFQSGLSGTVTLASALPPVTSPVEIAGPGPDQLTVKGIGNTTLTMSAGSGPSTVSGITMTNSEVGVRVLETTTISNVHFTGDERGLRAASGALKVVGSTFTGGHSVGYGGAIAADHSSLEVIDSTFTQNTAAVSGGAISVLGPGGPPVTISGSTFRSNVADSDLNGVGAGGAVFTEDGAGAVTITNSTFSENHAAFVGALRIGATTGPVNVASSTFSQNQASGSASSSTGAIALATNGPVFLTNSTITGNKVTGGVSSIASGVYVASASTTNRVTISDSTITGNTGAARGGGVYAYQGTVGALEPSIKNTVISGNAATQGPDIFNESGSPIDLSFSLVGDQTAAAPLSQTGPNLFAVDPKLGPLADNGGPTQTQALLPGSPAIDAGFSGAGTDQRGLARLYDDPALANAAGGNGADIGAYEIQAPPPIPPAPKCAGKTATIVATKAKTKGTKRNDVIVGRKGVDKIFGLGGNDTICGLGGNDRLYGGKGKDRLIGAAGRDKLFGGPGRDKLNGGPGKDQQKQ